MAVLYSLFLLHINTKSEAESEKNQIKEHLKSNTIRLRKPPPFKLIYPGSKIFLFKKRK